jgi:hypothetical protein
MSPNDTVERQRQVGVIQSELSNSKFRSVFPSTTTNGSQSPRDIIEYEEYHSELQRSFFSATCRLVPYRIMITLAFGIHIAVFRAEAGVCNLCALNIAGV